MRRNFIGGNQLMSIWKGGKNIRFHYVDSQGNHTDRDLLLRQVYDDGLAIYLQGYSYLREEERTFRFDRISGDIVDVETGQTGTLSDILNIPAEYLVGKEKGTPIDRSSRNAGKPRRRKQVKAASGFSFPLLFSPSNSLVKISDDTDYRSDFLSWIEPDERRAYSEDDFLEELEWSSLDIEVQIFEEIINANNLNKLGLSDLSELVGVIQDLTYGKMEGAIYIDTPALKNALSQGFLDEVTDYDAAKLRELLSSLRKDQLAPEAKKIGIKSSLKKAELIDHLIPNIDKLPFKFAVPSDRLYGLIDKIAGDYILDLKETLKSLDLPDAYHAAVWKQVEEDDTLPDVEREQASVLFLMRESKGQKKKIITTDRLDSKFKIEISVVDKKPFYKQVSFIGFLALVAVVIIWMIMKAA
ncbi:hypothetical protein DJ031_06750 [bacterium endosymbiont of Escarpia laminata]|nr:MAG: hypothetical protein DJ031_06750 [bacterium endosymbiont of Escarpia laminata]